MEYLSSCSTKSLQASFCAHACCKFDRLSTWPVIVISWPDLLTFVLAFEFVALFFGDTIISYSFVAWFLYRNDQHALARQPFVQIFLQFLQRFVQLFVEGYLVKLVHARPMESLADPIRLLRNRFSFFGVIELAAILSITLS